MSAKFLQGKATGYFAGVMAIALVTAICIALRSHVNDTTIPMAMPLAVLFMAVLFEPHWRKPISPRLRFRNLCGNF
jgi:hypothetical protein